MKNTEKLELSKTVKITLTILTIVMLLMLFWVFKIMLFDSYTSDEYYIIKRTDSNYEIVNEYKSYNLLQFVPKKSFVKLGLEYFCDVEMTDSTFIVDYLNYYLVYPDNFNYEGVRFYVWNLIEYSKDSSNIPISHINKDEIYMNSDTIYYNGLKIYNVEKYSFDKFIEYDSKNKIYYDEN